MSVKGAFYSYCTGEFAELVYGFDTHENIATMARREQKVICLWTKSVHADDAEPAGFYDENGKLCREEDL